MGDRAHLRRQGDMRKLEERDETFPGSTAYSAVPNNGSTLNQSEALSQLSTFLKKISPPQFRGSGQTVPE